MKHIGYFITLLLIVSCSNSKFRVDTSQIKLEVPIQRFDQDLFRFNFDDSLKSIASLEKKYGSFFQFYNQHILSIGPSNTPNYASLLNHFLSHEVYAEVYKVCNTTFTDVSQLETTLTEAFKRYNYFFPQKPVPAIYSYISGFNTAITVTDSLIGISLEDYLGSDHRFYDELNIYQYKRINMYPAKIPSDCLLGWLLTEFPNQNKKGDLLSEIIYRGAILAVLELLMPDEPTHRIIGYNKAQYQWALNHEQAMWTYIIDNKHLFTTDQRILKKYIGEAPFTYFFDKESAPQAGVFIGWQIVRSYLEHNNSIVLPELLKIKKAQIILERSGYQP